MGTSEPLRSGKSHVGHLGQEGPMGRKPNCGTFLSLEALSRCFLPLFFGGLKH